jgi:hypothetical protein
MNVWPPKFDAAMISKYEAHARHLRAQAFNSAFRTLFRSSTSAVRYAVAPFAFALRICSSSLGRISTKLHGR